MRRILISLATTAVAASLLLGGTPAKAASLSWEDAVDEPTAAAQGTWDLTKVTLDFDGTTLFMTLDVKSLGEPAPFGTGQYFAVRFAYGEGQYTFRLTQDRVNGDNFQFQERSGQNQVSTLTCRTCKAQLDFEGSKVIMQVGMESLQSAMRKLGPGQSIEAITALTGAAYSEPSGTFGTFLWNGSTPGDSAPAPDPAKFTF